MWQLLISFAAIVVAVRFFFKRSFSYWKKRNLPVCGKPTIPFGNFEYIVKMRTQSGDLIKTFYDEMKSKGYKHFGLYTTVWPSYIPLDLDYLKNIMVKDFNHFDSRGLYYNEKDDPLSAHLAALNGNKWRSLRTHVTPCFSISKIKSMLETFLECAKFMQDSIDLKAERNEDVDLENISANFSCDVIGSTAFGIECKTLQEENSEFKVVTRKIFCLGFSDRMSYCFVHAFPRIARFLKMKMARSNVAQFLVDIIKKAIDYRRRHAYIKNDLLQALLDLNNSSETGYLTDVQIAAQSNFFFQAGFETTSSTLSFALFEISIYSAVQEKLRLEINQVLKKHKGEMNYQALSEMTYMQQVIDETLRKYPPISVITRICTKRYNVPETNVILEKGNIVYIPVKALHYDEEYYPKSEQFDPDRFSEENKKGRHPMAFLPFGEGPRICLGKKFALIEIKVALATILLKYRLELSLNTRLPVELSTNHVFTKSLHKLYVKAFKIA